MGKDANNAPQLIFDGWYGIRVSNSNNIKISNLEIIGAALRITGEEATANRKRLTGRDDGGCGTASNESDCNDQSECKWSSSLEYCVGNTWSYYTGTGISIKSSTNVILESNKVHHCPGSGIHTTKSDNVTMTEN